MLTKIDYVAAPVSYNQYKIVRSFRKYTKSHGTSTVLLCYWRAAHRCRGSAFLSHWSSQQMTSSIKRNTVGPMCLHCASELVAYWCSDLKGNRH